ncbi:MAG TPA: hypothetical protein VMV55_00775 [Methanoregula sp.]|nr:hypothetical protein [Methanoregula sp.]
MVKRVLIQQCGYDNVIPDEEHGITVIVEACIYACHIAIPAKEYMPGDTAAL